MTTVASAGQRFCRRWTSPREDSPGGGRGRRTAPAVRAALAAPDSAGGSEPDGVARSGPAATERVWQGLRALVLERNERRKEIVEALGMSFFRVKALRRIAAQPSRMSELAARLASDRPYLTLVVDDLEKRGLVERRQHPTDRRCKIVSATEAGQAVAAAANAILGTPPPALRGLARRRTWPRSTGCGAAGRGAGLTRGRGRRLRPAADARPRPPRPSACAASAASSARTNACSRSSRSQVTASAGCTWPAGGPAAGRATGG